MSNDLRPVQSYINLEAIDAENDAMIRKVKETVGAIISEFKKTKGIELKLAADPASAKQIRQALDELGAAQKRLEKSTKSLSDIRSEQVKQEILYSRAKKEAANATRAETQATEASARAKIQEQKYTVALTKEKERLAKQEEKVKKELEKSLNAYELLKKKYADAANDAKRLGAELGVQSAEFKQASSLAMNYYKQLDEIEVSVGQAQRRVGQYERAQFSLNQVLREAPAFVNSLQTGFMAISNNLPMLTDEFNRLRQSGLSNVQSLKVFATGLFSVQTAISVGITLLTAYGEDIVKFISNSTKAAENFDRIKESQRILNSTIEAGSGIYKDATLSVSKLRVDIDLAKKGLLDKNEVLKEYNESIGKTTGQVNTLDEAERELVKNGPSYVKMMLFKAAANLALEDAAKKALEAERTRLKDIKEFDGALGSLGRSLNNLGALGSSPDAQKQAEENNRQAIGRLNKQSQERKEQTAKTLENESRELEKIAADYQKRAAEISTKLNFNFFGSSGTGTETQSRKFFDVELKSEAEGYRKISEGLQLYLESRISARKKAYEIEKQIIEENRNVELANAGKDEQQKIDIRRSADFELKQLRSEFYSDLLRIQNSYLDQQRSIEAEANKEAQDLFKSQAEEGLRNELQVETDRLEKRKAALSEARDIELAALEQNRAKTKMSEETYQRKRLQIETNFKGYLLKAEIEYTEAVISLSKARGVDVSKQEAELAAIKLDYSRNAAAGQIKDLLDVDKAEKALIEERKRRYEELGKQLLNLFSTLVTSGFEKQKNAIQEEINLLEERKQKNIEVANSTITNEQDRAAAIITINNRAAAEKERLERKQKDLDVRKAQFEKLAAVLSISIDTIQKVAAIKAQAALLLANPVTAVLAPVALAQIPIVIGGGALSAAAVLSRPVPRYAVGTEDHPGGHAIVGDGGKSEMVITPDGKLMLTPSVPTLMNLPEHSIVLPDAKKATELISLINPWAVESSTRNSISDEKILKGLSEAVEVLHKIESKEISSLQIKNGEFRKLVKKGASWFEYLGQNL